MNLSNRFLKNSKKWNDKTALIWHNEKITYNFLRNSILTYAKQLQTLGVKKGDRIILAFPNSPDFIACYYAILYTNAIVVPINTWLKSREISSILSSSQAEFGIFDFDLKNEIIDACNDFGKPVKLLCNQKIDGFAEKLAETKKITEDFLETDNYEETAVIFFTPGTTGIMKGVELTHNNLTSNATACVEILAINSETIISGVLPLFHSFGQTVVMNSTMLVGGTIVLLKEYTTPETIESLVKYKINIFAGVPTMYYFMVNHENIKTYDFRELKFMLSGGDSLPIDLAKQVEEIFGVKILEGYGLTETSPVVTFNQTFENRKLGSIGFPIYGVQVKLVDDDGNEVAVGEIGEIIVRGENVMKGYWNNTEATNQVLKNGWLYTGDMAWVDKEGYYYIADRKDDMIIKSGFNIYPKEVETVILQNPKVSEAAVIGVPDKMRGEEPKAYVVLKQNETAFAKEIIEFCRKNLANYKCPKYVEFCETLPKNKQGTILKKLLKSERRSQQILEQQQE